MWLLWSEAVREVSKSSESERGGWAIVDEEMVVEEELVVSRRTGTASGPVSPHSIVTYLYF